MKAKSTNTSNPVQKVTFAVSLELHTERVTVVGDFNAWNPALHPLAKAESGRWQTVLELDEGATYQYRYFVNGGTWYTDPNCAVCANPFGSENNVLTVSAPVGTETQTSKEVEHA
jgi:1,4-alpha-glucan branching enzyme